MSNPVGRPTSYNAEITEKIIDLVIDGQQRLTALLAAMYGVTIKDKNYKERKIRISFIKTRLFPGTYQIDRRLIQCILRFSSS
jgi:uncharacterized protein with ParB-like and HNH nuclease domain